MSDIESVHSGASGAPHAIKRSNAVNAIEEIPRSKPRAKIPREFKTLSIDVTEAHGGHRDPRAGNTAKDLSELEWHTLSTAEVCLRLGTSPNSGLDTRMAMRRLQMNGRNVISPPPKNRVKKLFFYTFGGFGSLIFLASIICFLAWKPLGKPNPAVANLALAIILLVVIIIQAGFNAWQDYSSSRVMESIVSLLPTDVLVVRDDQTFKLPAAELVAGDLIHVTLGCKVPADLRLVDVSADLRFDRSMLTGESLAIGGTINPTDQNFLESRNIALQGTLCESGSGIGICIGLGDATVFGRITQDVARERPAPTTLEIEIKRFVFIIAGLAVSVVIFIVILWAAWLRRDYPGFMTVPVLLVNCASVVVAVIPAGLPVCVTLSLTIVARAMRKAHVLCKSLSTIESLGAVNVICSDKTGTLTQNQMTVVNIFVGRRQHAASEALNMSAQEGSEGESIQMLAAIAGLCNDAKFEGSRNQGQENMKVYGDATDVGLLRFSASVVHVEALHASWAEIGKLAFNSTNKFALKMFEPKAVDSPLHPLVTASDRSTSLHSLLLVKGAPDILLTKCRSYIDENGQSAFLDREVAANISATQEQFSSLGQRVLLLAKRIITSEFLEKEAITAFDRLEEYTSALVSDLVVVGLVALVDPPRHDTAETVRTCRAAGIKFVMVTGDFSLTATAIASQVDIITAPLSSVHRIGDLSLDFSVEKVEKGGNAKTPRSVVISGQDLDTMSPSQWARVLAYDEIVFARTSPEQKLQIVRAFQSSGCTVAVTGDGVNDAPALKQADVGVAVAGGSEIAIEAADLILLHEFSAIVKGVEYGRLCFENLRKSILYLLPAGSFAELMPLLLNALFGLPLALSSIQMIIICVVTDVLPALSLVREKPEMDLLLRKPRDRRKDRLADFKLILHAYGFLGMFETLTAMIGAFYFVFQRNGIPFSSLWLNYNLDGIDPARVAELTNRAQSIYFFNLVLLQWFNLLATRTRRLSIFQQNPLGNRKTRNLSLFLSMVCALGFAIFFSYVPVFHRIFGTRMIKVEFFFLPMGYGIVMLIIDEVRKWYNRKNPRSLLSKIAW